MLCKGKRFGNSADLLDEFCLKHKGENIDIYRFIDSCDIREYLQKLNYRFTTPEAAFLVYWCKSASLKEKFAA